MPVASVRAVALPGHRDSSTFGSGAPSFSELAQASIGPASTKASSPIWVFCTHTIGFLGLVAPGQQGGQARLLRLDQDDDVPLGLLEGRVQVDRRLDQLVGRGLDGDRLLVDQLAGDRGRLIGPVALAQVALERGPIFGLTAYARTLSRS